MTLKMTGLGKSFLSLEGEKKTMGISVSKVNENLRESKHKFA